MFLVFEGIDGSGKSTQLKIIESWIKTREEFWMPEKVFIESEPTQDTDAGRKLHRLLQGEIDVLDQEKISDLYLEDRLQHSSKLRQLSDEGVVLASRYDLSTYAYQSLHCKEEEISLFFDTTYGKHRYHQVDGCLIPDLTLFFSLSPQEAMNRIESRYGIQGFEKLKVLEKVKKNYNTAIDYLCRRDGRQIKILDAMIEIDGLAMEIKKNLKYYFKEKT